jgi:hypothetical protein
VPVTRSVFDELLELGTQGIRDIIALEKKIIEQRTE